MKERIKLDISGEMIIEVGKHYDYFDDGKISESRKYNVIIDKILTLKEIKKSQKDVLDMWKEETNKCYWLYAKETDYFLQATLNLIDGFETIYFVRTVDNGWFSLGYWSGRLKEKSFWTKVMIEEEL